VTSITVVGGVYEEHCVEPDYHELLGSGLRAATALRAVADVDLHCALSEADRDAARAMCGAVGINLHHVARDEPVGFRYFTPMSAPLIDGANATSEALHVDGDTVLAFGMVEAVPMITARTLVYDPQRPRDLTALDLGNVRADRIVIVANRAETLALGGDNNIGGAAANLLDQGVAVVVTKLAAAGALVNTVEGQVRVGPKPTTSVWPLGSGDAFAAGLAWAYAQNPDDPVGAARVGSSVASACCGRGHPNVDRDAFEAPDAAPELDFDAAQVYLAAPFFDLADRWLVELAYEALQSLGAAVFSPLHDVGVGGKEVAQADLEGLAGCGAVLALLDGLDPGTVFEAGWAARGGIPLIGFARRSDDDQLKMLVGTGAEIHSDFSTAVYRAVWAAGGMPLQ
jgi:hypothetical protein